MAAVPIPRSETSNTLISDELAHFAEELRLDDVPDAVLKRAKLHILDALGIALASSTNEFAHRIVNALVGLAGRGDYPIIGFPHKLPIRDAVIANGALVHGIDFDDTHSAGVLHTSASALPMALAATQSVGGDGKDLLLAYLIHVETASRIAIAAKGGFHVNGFHPTGMVAIFGAVLAVGRLWGLTPAELANAQGLALSKASGSLEFIEDGAWNKRFHAGWAVAGAMTACALAKAGVIGARRTYEGRYGLFNIYLGDLWKPELSACTAGLGRTWEMLEVALKPYPVCHFNHAFIDAALALRKTHAIAHEEIESIQTWIGKDQIGIVCEPEANKRRPQNSYDARFSLPFAIAAALIHGRFTMDEISETTIHDRRVLALCDRTTYAIDEKSAYPRHYSGMLVIRLRDGRTVTHREDINRGSSAKPLSKADVLEKFRQTASRTLPTAKLEQVIRDVLDVESLADVEGFVSGLGPRQLA